MTPYTVEFRGRSAHASARPEAGISALDAVLQVFFSINQMRQMLRPAARIHGIITQGGTAVNVVPDRAVAEFQIREEDEAHLKPIRSAFAPSSTPPRSPPVPGRLSPKAPRTGSAFPTKRWFGRSAATPTTSESPTRNRRRASPRATPATSARRSLPSTPTFRSRPQEPAPTRRSSPPRRYPHGRPANRRRRHPARLDRRRGASRSDAAGAEPASIPRSIRQGAGLK